MTASTELNIILRDAAKWPLLRMTPKSDAGTANAIPECGRLMSYLVWVRIGVSFNPLLS